MSEAVRTNPIINGIQVLTIGLVLMEVVSALRYSSEDKLSSAWEDGYEGLMDGLYQVIRLDDLSDISPYFIGVLIVWAISGLAAGARAKHPVPGAFAAIFGISLAIALIYFLSLSAEILENEDMAPFAFGAVASLFVCCTAAIGTGKATQPKDQKRKVKKRARGAWEKKSKWKCARCKAELPPGALTCTECGTPVIE